MGFIQSMPPAARSAALVLVSLTLAACTAMTPSQALPGVEAQTIDNERQDYHPGPASNYLQLKEDELRTNRERLDRLRMSRDTDHFYELVKARDVFSRYPVAGDSPEQRGEVIDALNATAAQYLSSVGMTAAMLAALEHVAGFDVVESVGRIVGGGAEFPDLVAVSEHAVLGTAGATTGNGFSIHVVDGPSGLQGSSIGLAGGHQNAREGQECIFFLSESLQRFRTSASDNLAEQGGVTQQFAPFCRTQDGDFFASTYIQESVGGKEARRLMAEKKRASAHQ